MRDVPSYGELRSLDPRRLNGLLHAFGDPAWQATYERTWERDRETLKAVEAALSADPAEVLPHDSPPRWLEGIVARELREMSESCWAHRFDLIRLLERLDLVTPEHDAIYTLAFLSGLGVPGPGGRHKSGPGKVATLAQDPGLRDEMLWRLFEVEGGGEVSLANMDRFFTADSWRATFLRLVDEGTIERERVLVSCLEALQRDFNHYRAAWFSATYNAFEPSLEELERHQPHLRSILLSPLPASIAFSVRHLKALAKAKRLQGEETLPGFASAVLVRSKGTALDVLRLVAPMAEEHRALVLDVATAALGHEHADVQKAATTLLAKLGAHDAVLDGAAGLAASVQQSLGVPVAAAETTAIEQPLEAPVPAPSVDDLLERTASLLEGGFSAAELEAVLAGLVLHGTPELLRPLQKRATSVAKRASERAPGSLPGRLANLVLEAVGGAATTAPAPTTPEQQLLVGRLEEVRDTVLGVRPRRPLVATPDLPGWRLSRTTFVDRLGGEPAGRHDLVAALLRLDPADRAELAAVLPSAAAHPAFPDPAPRAFVGTPTMYTWKDDKGEHNGHYVTWGALALQHAESGDWVPVVAAARPHDAERFLALTVSPLLDAAGYPTVHHDIPVLLDTLARHPGRMGPTAALALAAGLVAGRGDQRMHAADAFVDLVATGRVPAAEVAAVLAQYDAGWTVTRAAGSLSHAAQAPGAAPAVVELLTRLVPLLGPGHRGLSRLLDVLLEQSLRLGVRATDPALCETLASITGSSKAAKTARALLG